MVIKIKLMICLIGFEFDIFLFGYFLGIIGSVFEIEMYVNNIFISIHIADIQ
jgi:hypothetical protein